jgi:hypothetical protein
MTSRPPFQFITSAEFQALSVDDKLRYVDRALAATVDYRALRNLTEEERLAHLDRAMDAVLDPLEGESAGSSAASARHPI